MIQNHSETGRMAVAGADARPAFDRAQWVATALAVAIEHCNLSRPADDRIRSARLHGLALPAADRGARVGT